MNKIRIFFVSILIIFFSASVLCAQTEQPLSKRKNQEVSYLFIEVAKKGELEKNKADAGYRLILHEADEWVINFTNVPHRVTGIMPVADFIKVVDDAVKHDYPYGLNSGVAAVKLQTNERLSYTMSLKNPKYDTQTHILVFDATMLPGAQKHPLPEKMTFSHVSVFVDNVMACTSCVGRP